ncbi:MAG: hypothetical protein J6Y87_04875, partial [Muribaculaceae bacterium]|nr:hypothetical protein [Muribaculaceae bacterium]
KDLENEKALFNILTDIRDRREKLEIKRAQQKADQDKEEEEANQRQIEAARAANERWKNEVNAIREANKELIERVKLVNLATLAEKNEQQALEEVDKIISDIQKRLNTVKDAQKFAQEILEGVDFNDMMDRLERESNPLYNFARTYEENAQAIQETSAALESSFSSLSQMYQQMASDESKTEEERARAAKKAKLWAGIQVSSNAGAAMAKGISGAMDAPTLVGKFAALATMTASLTAAIAQARTLLEGHEHGGVIGNKFIGATRGSDNILMTGRPGELVLNADQQKRLYDIANGSASSNLTASLVEAFRAMPAPVLVYSEFQKFANRVATLDNASKLN